MKFVAGYTFGDLIYRGHRSSVYRGVRQSDSRPVIIKLPSQDFPSPRINGRLEREYEIGKSFNNPHIIRYYALEKYEYNLALILEDSDAVSLKRALPVNGFDIRSFLSIAIQLTRGLRAIHHKKIIHKDIKPANLIISQDESKKVKFIDFGISSFYEREQALPHKPGEPRGTLAYISPEQTGRTNRPVDYRTDFYSLGVTFFELITGALPFTSEDHLELIHSQIAKNAPDVTKINSEIPAVISKIINKLMAKTAKSRYQSCEGLETDLEKCLQELNIFSKILDFEIAQNDFSDKLIISRRIYGRSKELGLLQSALNKARTGAAQYALIRGEAGVGKSSLVEEFFKINAHRKTIFARGYFESKSGTPYSAFIQAMEEVIKTILAESESTIQKWKKKFNESPGGTAGVLIDLIKDLDLLIDPVSLPEKVNPQETRYRFFQSLTKLIQTIAGQGNTFMLYLDDLDQADEADLELLKTLFGVQSPELRLLLIASYPNVNLNDFPHLKTFLNTIPTEPENTPVNSSEYTRKSKSFYTFLDVKPLGVGAVNELIRDSLKPLLPPGTRIGELSHILTVKTGGNPLALLHTLNALRDTGAIELDARKQHWTWDKSDIENFRVGENIFKLNQNQFGDFPAETMELLGQAACIGKRFSCELLAEILGETVYTLEKKLLLAVSKEILLPETGGGYEYRDIHENSISETEITLTKTYFSFLQEGVRQYAYENLDEEILLATHLKIGNSLLTNSRAKAVNHNELFAIIRHLNIAAVLLESESEKKQLANLNWQAGKIARSSGAPALALDYFRNGINVLPQNQKTLPLMRSLRQSCFECEFIVGNYENAEQHYIELLKNPGEIYERANIIYTRINLDAIRGNYEEAMSLGRELLVELNAPLPTSGTLKNELQSVQQELKTKLAQINLEEVARRSPEKDPKKIILVKILSGLAPPLFFTDFTLFSYIVHKTALYGLEWGYLPQLPYIFLTYGFLLLRAGEISEGFEIGRVALRLSEQYGHERGRTHHGFALHFSHLSYPLPESQSLANKAIQYCLEEGEMQYAGYAYFGLLNSLIHGGAPLSSTEEDINRALRFSRRTENRVSRLCFLVLRQFNRSLRGITREMASLEDQDFNEPDFLAQAQNIDMALAYFYFYKFYLFFIHKDYHKAKETAEIYKNHRHAISTFVTHLEFIYLYTLTLLILISDRNGGENDEFIREIEENISRLEKLQAHCSHNFRHKYELVQAEYNRYKKRYLEAMDLYDQAAVSARKGGFLQQEALAAERAGEFWLFRKKPHIAAVYMNNARLAYAGWNADRKVNQLNRNYKDLLTIYDQPGENTMGTSHSVSSGMIDGNPFYNPHTGSQTGLRQSSAMDFISVTRATAAISGEIEQERLLKTLIEIIIENAGANRGFIIMKRNNSLFIEAAGESRQDSPERNLPILLEDYRYISEKIVRYVIRTGATVMTSRAWEENAFMRDQYLLKKRPQSVLCMSLRIKDEIEGVLYLENELVADTFTVNHIEVLQVLLVQAAISLENAKLYRESRNTQDELRNYSRELESLNYSMAHDLRTPLRGISGFSQFLLKEYGPEMEGRGKDYLKRIAQGAIQMGLLIDNLLLMSRIIKDNLKRRQFDLAELAEDIFLKIKLKDPERDVEFRFVKPIWVFADYRLSQILLTSLLENAWKFTPSEQNNQSMIELGILNETDGETLTEHTDYKNTGYENITPGQTIYFVKDNGVGYDMNFQAKLFTPFEKLHDPLKYPGTGFGLALAKQAVNKHRGQIWSSSKPGEGSVFYFTLDE